MLTKHLCFNRYKVGADRRVSAIGIFNSGEFTAPATAKTAAAVGNKPVFYFLGGPSDIAYKNVCIYVREMQ